MNNILVNKGNGPERIRTGGRKGAQREGSYLFIYFFTRFKVMVLFKARFFFLSSLHQKFKVGGTEMFKFNKFGFGLLRWHSLFLLFSIIVI